MWTEKGTAGLSSGIHVSRSVDCRLQQTTIMAFRIIRHELLHELLDNCKNKGVKLLCNTNRTLDLLKRVSTLFSVMMVTYPRIKQVFILFYFIFYS